MTHVLNYSLRLLAQRNANRGFTLLELLVTVVILAILAAIALPSMLNQALRAREAEAQTYIGAVNRAQQTYRLERPAFASSTGLLNINVPSSTDNYTYNFGVTNAILGEYQAAPTMAGVRAFTGCVRASTGGLLAVTTTELEDSSTGSTPATPPNC